MNVKYKKEAKAALMILEGTSDHEEYAAKMLRENRIRGVLPLTIREIDGCREYCFDISCGRTLSGVLEHRQITLWEIRGLLSALACTVEEMDEYLMNVNHLFLEPGMICLPVESRRGEGGYERREADFDRPLFCCHPGAETDFLEQVRGLIRFFLNKMDHMEEQSAEKVYELFRISQKEYFRLEEMLEILEDRVEEAEVFRDVEVLPAIAREETLPRSTFDPEEVRIPEWTEGQRAGGPRPGLRLLLGPALLLLGLVLCLWNLVSLFLPIFSLGGLGEQSIWAGLACLAAGAMITLMAGAELSKAEA